MANKKGKLPRHSAGSMELKEGTGPITAMCSCGDFLEIYKMDKTYRIRTPENIDPEGKNPNAPWIASPVEDVGSANRIVARVLLQGREILQAAAFKREVDIENLVKKLHSCKETLVICERIAKEVASQIDKIIAEVKSNGIARDNKGRGLNPFPQVPNLEAECGSFLIHANRAIKIICELPKAFIDLERSDSNFDYLARRLDPIFGAGAPMIKFINVNADGVRYLTELRNYHEHPKDKKTIIENFKLTPDANIQMPMWYVSDKMPKPIKEDMIGSIDFLIAIAEAMLIHLVMATVTEKFPYIITEMEESKIDHNKPIKYRLSLDVNKLKFE